jgi:uncharacterized protein (TIGR00730 family)
MPKKLIKKKATKNKLSGKKFHIDNTHLCLPAKELKTKPVFKGSKKDWRESPHWRVFKIMSEFVDGFQFLGDFRKTVTFFGSARFNEKSEWYQEAQKLGGMLANEGFTVITGGGPGIMEAGNRGASEAGGESVGVNIKLPYEQRINRYVKKSSAFHYFFVRKVILAYSAQAYVYFPGGFGTMDEFFELLTLVQTNKLEENVPLVLVGKDFWGHVDQLARETLLKEYGTVDQEDVCLYTIVDSAEEAMQIIRKSKPRKEFESFD